MILEASLYSILQEFMEQNTAEMALNLGHMRPPTPSKASPTTSSESEKGVDVLEQPVVIRKRHRRGKHRRKWKPYSSMTAEERKVVDEREAARAARREANLVGKPSAPWNTTQFIMEDRGCNDIEVHIPTPRASRTLSLEDSFSDEDLLYESPEDELFEQHSLMEQDFESTYQEIASERLQGLSKADLIEECLKLDRELHDHTRDDSTSRKEMIELRARMADMEEENRLLLQQQQLK